MESGMMTASYVKVEVSDTDDRKISLIVNPVGRFSPGGCEAYVSVKQNQITDLNTADEIFDYLLRKIYFENLESSAGELPGVSLGEILSYTDGLQEDEDNSWWLKYFRGLSEKVSIFHRELLKMDGTISEVRVHQYHDASGELCDFVDYICCPEGEDEEVLRSFFEDSLSDDSDIDEIMDCFEDGYFYGSSYESDEVSVIDVKTHTVTKTMTVKNVR